jgi:hypothetical protein
MDTRYHIEEMVSQDAKGVVFQGTDSVTGVIVAMRRFLASGGGSPSGDSGPQAYADAIEQLKQVTHPSLRRVLSGGCDPVDEMPYLVTRWVEGTPLNDLLTGHGALDPELAIHVMAQFLDANAVIAEALGRDGLWLEPTIESITVKPARNGVESLTACFWLCPWRWLCGEDAQAGEASGLADLGEAMLGGPRQMAAHHAGHDFATWVEKIRSKEFADLGVARQALRAPGHFKNPFGADEAPDDGGETSEASGGIAESVGEAAGFDPPGLRIAPAVIPTMQATAVLPSMPGGKKAIHPGVVAGAVVFLGLIAFGSWLVVGRDNDDSASLGNDSTAASVPVSRSQAKVDGMVSQIQGAQTAAEERRQHIERRGYYTIDEADLMLSRDKQDITFRGRLARVRMSSSGLTMYLEFSEDAPNEQPRAYAMMRNIVDGIRPEELELLVGKTLEIRGPVDMENIIGTRRPRVRIMDRSRIEVLSADEDFELR